MGTPLELVKYNQATGKFEVGEQAVAVLRKVRGPLGVVAVSGRARQGKSFILNQLLQQTEGAGFTVGPTHRPCTKGLWMWSSPQRRVAPDGSESHLVLLDTEGIDAYDQTAQYSTQIFSLAVLLSCLFVYNHMGGIDESALDRLSLVTEMTKHIRVKAGAGDDANLGEFTPSFLWLLRDFYLKLEEEGKKITARDYLETALMPVEGTGPSVDAKNGIRASIKSLFPDRDCFALVRPHSDESRLANLDHVPMSELRPEFREGVRKLVNFIFSKASPKRFGSGLMTGPVMAGLVEAYVKAINEGAVPTIATAWQGVAESESRRAADLAETKYKESFNADVEGDERALMAEHQRCKDLARAAFEEVAVGDENIRKAHEKKLWDRIETLFKDTSGRKLAEAASKVNEMLYKANMEIHKVARSGGSMSMLQGQLAKFVEEFSRTATGPTKWEKLAEFLKDAYPAIANEVIAKSEASVKAKMEAAQAEAEEAKQAITAMQARMEQAEREHRSASGQANALQAEVHRLQQQVATLQAELDKKTAHVIALESQLKETSAVSEKKVYAALEEAKAQVAAAQEETARKVAQAQAAMTQEHARIAGLESDVAALTQRCAALETSAAGAQDEISEWRTRYNASVEEKVNIMRERDEAREAATSLQVEREGAARERSQAQMRLAQLQARVEAEQAHKVDMQQRLDEMIAEAQAARSAARAAAAAGIAKATAALQQHRASNYENLALANGSHHNQGGGDLSNMSMNELRDYLVEQGFEADVWELQGRKPAPKKSDWLELVQQRTGSTTVV